MTHVHYKFSSKLSYDTVVFDGPHVTLRDLKRQIMGREKLRAGDCDLQITNAQTKEEYTDDEGLIPKGSSVIVRRIPIIGGKSSSNSKTRNIERSDVHHHHAFGAAKAMDDQSSSRALPFFSKMANLADADASEEDKIKVMINQSTYDSMNYNKKFGTVLPANYTCYRCGNTGHHIRNCPTSGQDKNFEAPMRIKKSTGIPRSFMVEVDDPSIKGAMLTNCGRYAIPAIDAEAYAIGKKEKPPFLPQEQPKSEVEKDPVPQELLCLICHDLSSDAVVIPCCGNSYCDDCIRTALLDSEDHVCPTCGQSDVSPDTLIANKFLRQAVNTFKKEQGHTKSLSGGCGTSQSQNPSPTPSPVPTPPPPTMQIQPPKLHQSSQQDPLLSRSQAADTPPQAPTTATGPASASAEPSTSLQPVQSHLETSDKEAKEKTHDDSAAADPCVLVSHKEPTAAPSQLIPLVNQSPAVEQPPAVSVNPQQSSSGPAPRQPGPSTSRDSSSSSSGCPTGGWNKSNTLQLPPSSSSSLYPATPPPLFPSPHFHTFLATQQPCNSYPHGYPPTTPVWTLPTPQGAPIPSLCSTTTTSSIPTLIPKEWYMHQRKTKERSPQRGSTHRRSSSRSNSKSYKAKSSRSYSRSSSRSRSRSRSRSQGRSRPHSPYSRHRDLHTRSHSSHYSYGYKRSRSPTPSSSSSPRVGYHSRSKSPMDRRKNSHHSRHHSKKSASSSCNSRRRREDPKREAGGPEGNLDSYLYAQRANQTSSLELDRERYLQWKKEYKEWCDKYFSSYVGHFNQLPPPLLNLPPPPLHPQWGDKEGSRNLSQDNLESRKGLQGRRSARMDGRSPPSQSSSDSRSPPSQSSSDSRSTPSQSSSDSRSSPSHSSNDSRSPPSQSSSDGRSSPSKDGAQPTTYQQRCAEKYSRPPITKGGKEVELQVRSKDNKQLITKNFENISTLKHEQNSMKKQQEGRGEDSSSPDAADSTDDCRNDKRRHNTGPNARKDGTPERDEATASDALESVRPLVKPDKRLDKDYERRSRGQRNLEMEKGWRRGKHSDSRQDMERQHKEKPSKGAGRVDTDRYRNPGGSKDSDSRSEKNRKRKGEDMERSSVKAQSSKCLKTKIPEVTETHKSESLFPFDRKKQNTEIKKERKTWPLTEKDIWEGGIKVKPQKKISINIKLDGKRTEDKTEKQDLSYLESITGKTKDETEKIGNGEEKLHRGETEIEVNEKKDSVFEEKIKPDEGESRQLWEKATFRDDKGGMRETNTGEKMENRQDFDLWHCAIRGVEEEKKESKKQSKGEEVTNDENMRGGKEEEWMMRKELVAGTQKERAEGESTRRENRGNPPREPKPKKELMEGKKWRMRNEEDATVDDGSSNYEDDQVRKTVGKTLEEITQERAADGENELVFIQVPRSIWEKEESEEEQGKRAIKVQKDALAVFLPSPSMSVTAETSAGRDTEGEIEQMTQRSVEMERDRARAMVRGRDREREKNSILSSSHRSVAPSSGKDRHDSNSCPGRDGERERRMETERPRDRERGRESERQSYRQKENKRLTERTRDEEKGRERGHSSVASGQKRNTPSSSQSYTYLTSHDTERRDRQREGDPGKSKSSSCPSGKFSSGRKWESSATSRATGLPDQNAHKTLLDSAFKDKDHPQYYHSHQSHAGTHHSPLPLSHSRGKERDPLPSESPGGSQRGSELGQPRMSSPGGELMQNRSRNESKVERGEWERNKVDKVVKEGIWEIKNQKMVAEREGSYLWEDEADELDGPTKWEGGRELEEGERPSSRSNSVSSSASQEGNMDDRRNEWKKKQKKHKTENRQPVPELLEEGELKKHRHKKKSKKERDGGEEESDGEADAELCQVMLS